MYNVVLTDRSWVPQGEVTNFSSFNFFRGLNKLATVAFTVRLDNAHVDRLSATDGNIKVYRNSSLIFHGPIVSAEEAAESESQTLAITAADIGWMLGHRVVGKSAAGTLTTVATDRSLIAKTMIDAVNATAETGLSTAAYTFSAGSAITHKYGPYALALPVLQELGGALDGFDWIVNPVENWVNGSASGVKVGAINMQTVIGSNRPSAVFEYGVGTRSNVLNYGLTTTRDQQANQVYHFLPDSSTVSTGTDATAITDWGLLEDVAAGDFTDATYRQKLVDEHVRVRKYPRTLVRMTPHIDPGVTGRLPQPLVDYDAGDTITARFVHNRKVRFAGFLRVFGIRISLDNGFERVELTLEDDT
jgi:hypothetical protein